MALFRKCCWCGVRRGSICAAFFSMMFSVFLFILCFKIQRTAKQMGENKGTEWLFYVTYVFSVMIFISAMLVIRGILDDRRDSRYLLMPFIVLMSIYVVIQISASIQGLVSGSPIYVIILLILATSLCILLDLCVVSQYQELKDGRGTKTVNTTEESPVMYIAVSERMTLPFSREGSEGAAMYTTRVPSPELHLDNSLNPNNCMGSKSVEPSRRWTSIDYDYPIRPHSSAAGSYIQNLDKQDAASTHNESTFFFPINNNDEPEPENALATVPSAPSEYGSFAPVGRALSYPSTPANNTPYLSATMNRKPMVEMRASSRSLSHLEVAGKQQPAEYFGARRLVPPPQYYILSSHEKIESIV